MAVAMPCSLSSLLFPTVTKGFDLRFRKRVASIVCVLLALTLGVAAPALAEPSGEASYESAVVGGEDAPPGSFPFIVALARPGPGPFGDRFYCGGTLIGRGHWVLTAAHCVTEFVDSPSSLEMVIGRQDLYANDGESIVPKHIYVHPDYRPTTAHPHDLALIQLPYQSRYQSIARMGTDEPVWNDDDGVVAGWGSRDPRGGSYPARLQSASLPIWSDGYCQSWTDKYTIGVNMCAGSSERTACDGDSGGPLLAYNDSGWLVVAGIVSFGRSPCGSAPGNFTRVGTYVHWITNLQQQVGENGGNPPQSDPSPAEPPAPSGHWMVTSDGQVFAFGDSRWHGDWRGQPHPTVGIASRPGGAGYWLVDDRGTVGVFGLAPHRGSVPAGALRPGERVSTIAALPTGDGYWIFTTLGRVFPFGTAVHHGDLGQVKLNGPVVAAAATPSGRGYYMVGTDGGVFTFGDAAFRGSTGSMRLNQPVNAIVPDHDGSGYWLVASDGGIFAFDAPFHGSMGGTPLNRAVVGMSSPGTSGYLMVGADGGIFTFGGVEFHGSLGSSPPSHPVRAVDTLRPS
ncbi:MAG TPA: serine protease [Acidimicrobiales bacterium]|nr:serine protease [Acidimicrobiales bacterium]